MREQNLHDQGSNQEDPEEAEKTRWNQRPWFWFFLMLAMVLVTVNLFTGGVGGTAQEVSSSRLFEEARRNNIERLEEPELDIFVATLKSPIQVTVADLGGEKFVETSRLRSTIPPALKLELFQLTSPTG